MAKFIHNTPSNFPESLFVLISSLEPLPLSLTHPPSKKRFPSNMLLVFEKELVAILNIGIFEWQSKPISMEKLFSYFLSHTDQNISLSFYINIAHSSIWGGLRSIFEDLFCIVSQYINNTFCGIVFQSGLSFEGQKEAFGTICLMMKTKQTMIWGRWMGYCEWILLWN